jgi:hypothetical protein
MLSFHVFETIAGILSAQIFYTSALLNLIRDIILCLFLIFIVWWLIWIVNLIRNVLIILSNICNISMCVKELMVFYLHRYYVHLRHLFLSEISYYVFFRSSLFDDWFEFSILFWKVIIVIANICFVWANVKQLMVSYLQIYFEHLPYLIWSENSYCNFSWSSLFDDWFEFSNLFRNVIIVIADIFYISTCVKQLMVFYLHRYFVQLLLLLESENSYCVFFWSSVFDDWFEL